MNDEAVKEVEKKDEAVKEVEKVEVDYAEKLKDLESENQNLKQINKDGAIKDVDHLEKIKELESTIDKAVEIGTNWKNKYLDLKADLDVETDDDEGDEKDSKTANPYGIRQ